MIDLMKGLGTAIIFLALIRLGGEALFTAAGL